MHTTIFRQEWQKKTILDHITKPYRLSVHIQDIKLALIRLKAPCKSLSLLVLKSETGARD